MGSGRGRAGGVWAFRVQDLMVGEKIWGHSQGQVVTRSSRVPT